jgi:transcriptional regulator with XRE-family HTH domain
MSAKTPKEPAYPFGLRLRAARLHAGLTTTALAQLVGTTQSTLSTAESTGQGSSFVCRIARVCGVNPYWLETGEEDMFQDASGIKVSPTEAQQPRFSPEAESLAIEFDEAPLGRSTKGLVHRLCLAIMQYGGLPPYQDLAQARMLGPPAAQPTLERAPGHQNKP